MPIPSVMYSQTHLYTVLVKQCQGCEPTNNLHCVCVCLCLNVISHCGLIVPQWSVYKAKMDKQLFFVWPLTLAAHTLSVQHTHTPTHSRTQITCLLSAFSYRLCNDGLIFPSTQHYTWLQRHPTYCVPIVVLFTTDMCSCTHTDTQGRWIVCTTKREDTCKEKGGGFDFVVFKNKSVGLVYLERFSIICILLNSHSRCGSALLYPERILFLSGFYFMHIV